jgi:hypothetical protein
MRSSVNRTISCNPDSKSMHHAKCHTPAAFPPQARQCPPAPMLQQHYAEFLHAGVSLSGCHTLVLLRTSALPLTRYLARGGASVLVQLRKPLPAGHVALQTPIADTLSRLAAPRQTYPPPPGILREPAARASR